MYTPIIASISYGSEVTVGFQLDIESLKDLVENSITSVNRGLVYFARSKDKKKGEKYIALKMSKGQLTNEIGINMEILEKAVFMSTRDKDIEFNDEPNQNGIYETKGTSEKKGNTIYQYGGIQGIYKTIYKGKSEYYLTNDNYIQQAEKQ